MIKQIRVKADFGRRYQGFHRSVGFNRDTMVLIDRLYSLPHRHPSPLHHKVHAIARDAQPESLLGMPPVPPLNLIIKKKKIEHVLERLCAQLCEVHKVAMTQSGKIQKLQEVSKEHSANIKKLREDNKVHSAKIHTLDIHYTRALAGTNKGSEEIESGAGYQMGSLQARKLSD